MYSNNNSNVSRNLSELKSLNQQWNLVGSLQPGESLSVDSVGRKVVGKYEAVSNTYGGAVYGLFQSIQKSYYGDKLENEVHALKCLASATKSFVSNINDRPVNREERLEANRCYREVWKLNKKINAAKNKAATHHLESIQTVKNVEEKNALLKQLKETAEEINEMIGVIENKITLLNGNIIDGKKPFVFEIVGEAFGRPTSSDSIPGELSIHAVKAVFVELFGKRLTKEMIKAYGFQDVAEIGEADIVALVVGIMANMTYDDLRYISMNKEKFFKVTGYEFFRNLPEVNEENAVEWMKCIREGFTDQKFVNSMINPAQPPSYSAQILKDISVLKAAQSYTHYKPLVTIAATDQYGPTVREFGLSEYFSKEIAPAILSTDSAFATNGALIPIEIHDDIKSTSFVASVHVLGNKNGVGAILVKPLGIQNSPCYVVFHATSDTTSRTYYEQITAIKKELESHLEDNAHVICMGDRLGALGAGYLANALVQDSNLNIGRLGVHAFEGCIFDPKFSSQFVVNVQNNNKLQSVEIENFELKGSGTMLEREFLGQMVIPYNQSDEFIFDEEDLGPKKKITFNLYRVFSDNVVVNGSNSLKPIQEMNLNSISPVEVVNKLFSSAQRAEFYLKTGLVRKQRGINVQKISSSDEEFREILQGTFKARVNKSVASLEHEVTAFICGAKDGLARANPSESVGMSVPRNLNDIQHPHVHMDVVGGSLGGSNNNLDQKPFGDNIIVINNGPQAVPKPPDPGFLLNKGSAINFSQIKKTPEEKAAELKKKHYKDWETKLEQAERNRVSGDAFHDFVRDENEINIKRSSYETAERMSKMGPMNDGLKGTVESYKKELELAEKGVRKLLDINNDKNKPIYRKKLEEFTNFELKLIAYLHYRNVSEDLISKLEPYAQRIINESKNYYLGLNEEEKKSADRVESIYKESEQFWVNFFKIGVSRDIFLTRLDTQMKGEKRGLLGPQYVIPDYEPRIAPNKEVAASHFKNNTNADSGPVKFDPIAVSNMKGMLKKIQISEKKENSEEVANPKENKPVFNLKKRQISFTDEQAESEASAQLNIALATLTQRFGNYFVKENELKGKLLECQDKLVPLESLVRSSQMENKAEPELMKQYDEELKRKEAFSKDLEMIVSVRNYIEGNEGGITFIRQFIDEAQTIAANALKAKGVTEDQIKSYFDRFRMENEIK